MTNAPLRPPRTPSVSLPQKDSVTLGNSCLLCRQPARRKYCSSACRQAAYRQSPAHLDNLKRLKDRQRLRREAWLLEKRLYKTLAFDGRESGDANKNVPKLADFQIYTPEFYISRALHEIFQS